MIRVSATLERGFRVIGAVCVHLIDADDCGRLVLVLPLMDNGVVL